MIDITDIDIERFILLKGAVQSINIDPPELFEYFEFFFLGRFDRLAQKFEMEDGTSIAERKDDIGYFFPFRDHMKDASTFKLNFWVKLWVNKNEQQKERAKAFIKSNKRRRIGHLDDIELEIFRLTLADFSSKSIICFKDFCPNTLLINYPDMSKVKEIESRIEAFRAEGKYIIFLNSDKNICNYPTPDVGWMFTGGTAPPQKKESRPGFGEVIKQFFSKRRKKKSNVP